MALKERQKSILDAAVFEYIRTAKPVASRELLRFNRDVSSATIRGEFLRLDVLGYLEQPYTSAGRVPTDKGYRFFVDNTPADVLLTRREEQMVREIFAEKKERDFVKELARTASFISGAFAAAAAAEDEIFYESGLARVFAEPEFADADNVRAFSRFIDRLDQEAEDFFAEFEECGEENEKIFIGAENRLAEARNCAMIAGSWRHPSGFRGFLAVLGPKRTDYRKHKAFFKTLRNVYDE